LCGDGGDGGPAVARAKERGGLDERLFEHGGTSVDRSAHWKRTSGREVR
jgi:hypothetical protein